MSNKVVNEVDAMEKNTELFDWLVNIRRHLHSNPELGFKENETADFIVEKLIGLGVEDIKRIGGTGVVAKIAGTGESKKTVGLRADMDALPMQEENSCEYRSRNKGVMHACGHDGHVAMLLGAVNMLLRNPPKGDVVCIFQPAEEYGTGAKKLVEEEVLDSIDVIFTGHIDTHFETGIITVDEGVICAYADPFFIHIKGRGGHAARPHEATDAVVAASSLVTIMQTLVSREVDPNRSAVVTVGSFQAGTALNVIADEAILKGTIRSTDKITRQKTVDGLERIVQSIGDMYGVQSSLHFQDGLPAVYNEIEATKLAREAAFQVTDPKLVVSQGAPSLGGEDFSFYQEQIPGCMVRFGGRKEGSGVAHSSTFDFDEKVLLVGAQYFVAIANSCVRQ